MIFNSLKFIIFFPIVILVYFFIPKKYRKYWLLFTSYYFYMSWNIKYIFLLLFVTADTYLTGRLIENRRLNKKFCLIICIVLNLLILIYYKYLDFLIELILPIIGIAKTNISTSRLDIVLPIGISFFIFQSIGYIIDVYKGTIKAEKNYIDYSLFIAFFPQILAGPIGRAKSLLSQFKYNNGLNYYNFQKGLLWMLYGYFLKIVVADRLGIFVDNVYNNLEIFNGLYYLAATFLFAIQIYCDFYGYSLLAKGAAQILGIELMDNFNTPYLSISIADFWRRWHISLSSWFRDYLYIPLGGNRKGKIRKYINILIVFSCSGLWHGASITYVIWGLLNGIYQIIEDLFNSIKNNLKINKYIKIVITFVLVCSTWVFFRANSINDSVYIYKKIFDIQNYKFTENGFLYYTGIDFPNFIVISICIIILISIDYLRNIGIKVNELILKRNDFVIGIIMSLSIVFILLFGIWGPEYNVSSFIYFNF